MEQPLEKVSRLAGVTAANEHALSGVYFFLSLDLVNSTTFKDSPSGSNWPAIMRSFYDACYEQVRKFEIWQPSLWKHVGDEVLFYVRIHSLEELSTSVTSAFRALQVVNQTVANWTNRLLGVKGTCWIALLDSPPPAEMDSITKNVEPGFAKRNIVFATRSQMTGLSAMDFLGPDIDIGFRISSFSAKGCMVLSAELAHLLWTHAKPNVRGGLRLIEYRQLKGVWGNRHYPIAWYHESWADLHSTFDYDEPLRYESLRQALTVAKNNADAIDTFKATFEQLGRFAAINKIVTALSNAAPVPDPQVDLVIPETEIHCVAICFASDGRIMVARRLETKASYPGLWEFGCAKLRPGQTFQHALAVDYKGDFGLELELDWFVERGAFGSYWFKKFDAVVSGVVFAAKANNPEVAEKSFNPRKHSEVRWIEPSQFSELAAHAVPGAVDRVRRAAEVWTEYNRVGPTPTPQG